MKRGDQAKIAKHTGLARSTVCNYFLGRKMANETESIIELAIDELQITDFTVVCNDGKLNKANDYVVHDVPMRKDRYDIYSNLPKRSISKIAKTCNVNRHQVVNVLSGRRTDHSGIIKEAELMAAINIWKTRFCKYQSML